MTFCFYEWCKILFWWDGPKHWLRFRNLIMIMNWISRYSTSWWISFCARSVFFVSLQITVLTRYVFARLSQEKFHVNPFHGLTNYLHPAVGKAVSAITSSRKIKETWGTASRAAFKLMLTVNLLSSLKGLLLLTWSDWDWGPLFCAGCNYSSMGV